MNISAKTKLVFEKLDNANDGITFSDIKKVDTNKDANLSIDEAKKQGISVSDVNTINSNIFKNYSKHNPKELVFPSLKDNKDPAMFNKQELDLLRKQFGLHGEKGIISKVLIPIGEAIGKTDALSKIYQHHKEIKDISKQYNVDPLFVASIIYEEQSHLLPFEELNDSKGSGTSIGLSQVGVGELIKQGFYPDLPIDSPVSKLTPEQLANGRDYLVIPKNNIKVLARQVQRLQDKLGYAPETLKADTYFGAHALSKIAYIHNGFSDYPRRVMDYMKSDDIKNALDGKIPFPIPIIKTPPMGS